MGAGTSRSPLRLPDPTGEVLQPTWEPEPGRIASCLNRMILSASGWRTVFAGNDDENSPNPYVSPEHLLLAGLAARSFAKAILRDRADARVAVGQDTRPTGSSLAQCGIRVFLAMGIEPEYLWVTPSPEIMAVTGSREDLDGFFYISASHNPIGHNGFKMGLGDGSVIGGLQSSALIARFRQLARDPAELSRTAEMLRGPGSAGESGVVAQAAARKQEARAVYRLFSESVVRGPGPYAETAFDGLKAVLRAVQPGIVADMNGSARCLSIDQTFLGEAGCRVHVINDTAGKIAHQIVPEGDGLSECVRALRTLSSSDAGFILGYVPDNDGDRGNLVIAEKPGEIRPLEAQEVFALAAVAELSWLRYTGIVSAGHGPDAERTAIVVNGPTSMRIDRIASALGVEVHRAEVGEANVVGRARELRESGRLVRFLGEGSNGGNITHPSTVRDPLQTVFAVLKLLYAPGHGETPSPASFWLESAGLESADGPATLAAIVDSLPVFTTTSAFESRAIMRVRSAEHGPLKDEVERLWERSWPELGSLRARLGVSRYSYENYEGKVCRPGKANRTGAGRGGFKILLSDAADVARAFLWMRGSGTEPVFRVMVDVEGDHPDLEGELLEILRSMVSEADRTVSGGER